MHAGDLRYMNLERVQTQVRLLFTSLELQTLKFSITRIEFRVSFETET